MVSGLYAGFSALLIVWLSLNVIKLRRSHKVVLGDGNFPGLQNAIRAHGNAIESIPIALILLVLLELNGGYSWLVHLGGIALIIGRLFHARGLLTENIGYRILGMQFTIFTLTMLAASNIFFFVYTLIYR